MMVSTVMYVLWVALGSCNILGLKTGRVPQMAKQAQRGICAKSAIII